MLTKCPRAFCIHSQFLLPLSPTAGSPRRGIIAIAISYFLPRFGPAPLPSPSATMQGAIARNRSLLTSLLVPLAPSLPSPNGTNLGYDWDPLVQKDPSACCLYCCCCGTGIGSLQSVLLQLMKGNLVLGRDSMVSRIVRLGLGVIAFGNGVH